jgi:hypothetical protein
MPRSRRSGSTGWPGRRFRGSAGERDCRPGSSRTTSRTRRGCSRRRCARSAASCGARSPRGCPGRRPPEQFAHEVVGVWLSFWAQLGQQPELARVQRVYERRLRSNLLHALRQLAPSDVAEQLATGLSALIDGLWLRSALGGAAVAPRDARRIGRDYITNGLERLAGGRAEPT